MSLHYICKAPENIHAQTPILMMMHGYGSQEEDLFALHQNLPTDWLIVSFRAPNDTPYGGFSWYPIDFDKVEHFYDETEARISLKLLMTSLVEIKNKYEITDTKVHLCAFSQGGVMAYKMALMYPQYFEKVAILSSYPETRAVGQLKTDVAQTQHLDFFISHGTQDGVIPLEWAREAAPLLEAHGLKFTFREYLSGHNINQKNYLDLMTFFNPEAMVQPQV
jgi:phospholipase/carboxylesterase